jgi:hypothetical protein
MDKEYVYLFIILIIIIVLIALVVSSKKINISSGTLALLPTALITRRGLKLGGGDDDFKPANIAIGPKSLNFPEEMGLIVGVKPTFAETFHNLRLEYVKLSDEYDKGKSGLLKSMLTGSMFSNFNKGFEAQLNKVKEYISMIADIIRGVSNIQHLIKRGYDKIIPWFWINKGKSSRFGDLVTYLETLKTEMTSLTKMHSVTEISTHISSIIKYIGVLRNSIINAGSFKNTIKNTWVLFNTVSYTSLSDSNIDPILGKYNRVQSAYIEIRNPGFITITDRDSIDKYMNIFEGGFTQLASDKKLNDFDSKYYASFVTQIGLIISMFESFKTLSEFQILVDNCIREFDELRVLLNKTHSLISKVAPSPPASTAAAPSPPASTAAAPSPPASTAAAPSPPASTAAPSAAAPSPAPSAAVPAATTPTNYTPTLLTQAETELNKLKVAEPDLFDLSKKTYTPNVINWVYNFNKFVNEYIKSLKTKKPSKPQDPTINLIIDAIKYFHYFIKPDDIKKAQNGQKDKSLIKILRIPLNTFDGLSPSVKNSFKHITNVVISPIYPINTKIGKEIADFYNDISKSRSSTLYKSNTEFKNFADAVFNVINSIYFLDIYGYIDPWNQPEKDLIKRMNDDYNRFIKAISVIDPGLKAYGEFINIIRFKRPLYQKLFANPVTGFRSSKVLEDAFANPGDYAYINDFEKNFKNYEQGLTKSVDVIIGRISKTAFDFVRARLKLLKPNLNYLKNPLKNIYGNDNAFNDLEKDLNKLFDSIYNILISDHEFIITDFNSLSPLITGLGNHMKVFNTVADSKNKILNTITVHTTKAIPESTILYSFDFISTLSKIAKYNSLIVAKQAIVDTILNDANDMYKKFCDIYGIAYAKFDYTTLKPVIAITKNVNPYSEKDFLDAIHDVLKIPTFLAFINDVKNVSDATRRNEILKINSDLDHLYSAYIKLLYQNKIELTKNIYDLFESLYLSFIELIYNQAGKDSWLLQYDAFVGGFQKFEDIRSKFDTDLSNESALYKAGDKNADFKELFDLIQLIGKIPNILFWNIKLYVGVDKLLTINDKNRAAFNRTTKTKLENLKQAVVEIDKLFSVGFYSGSLLTKDNYSKLTDIVGRINSIVIKYDNTVTVNDYVDIKGSAGIIRTIINNQIKAIPKAPPGTVETFEKHYKIIADILSPEIKRKLPSLIYAINTEYRLNANEIFRWKRLSAYKSPGFVELINARGKFADFIDVLFSRSALNPPNFADMMNLYKSVENLIANFRNGDRVKNVNFQTAKPITLNLLKNTENKFRASVNTDGLNGEKRLFKSKMEGMIHGLISMGVGPEYNPDRGRLYGEPIPDIKFTNVLVYHPYEKELGVYMSQIIGIIYYHRINLLGFLRELRYEKFVISLADHIEWIPDIVGLSNILLSYVMESFRTKDIGVMKKIIEAIADAKTNSQIYKIVTKTGSGNLDNNVVILPNDKEILYNLVKKTFDLIDQLGITASVRTPVIEPASSFEKGSTIIPATEKSPLRRIEEESIISSRTGMKPYKSTIPTGERGVETIKEKGMKDITPDARIEIPKLEVIESTSNFHQTSNQAVIISDNQKKLDNELNKLGQAPLSELTLYGFVVDKPGDMTALQKAIAFNLGLDSPANISSQNADWNNAATGWLYNVVQSNNGHYISFRDYIVPGRYKDAIESYEKQMSSINKLIGKK